MHKLITVGIATLNRHEALTHFALSSLLNQESSDFEVLIWDASDDDLTEKAVKSFSDMYDAKRVPLRYFRAPRKGLTAQRNDLVKQAHGDIIFFIDDDSEISVDAITSLIAYFVSFPWLKGAALPVVGKVSSLPRGVISRLTNSIKRLVFPFFYGFESKRYRKIRRSTVNIYPLVDSPGVADWLTGAGMAFRKDVFDKLSFEERLIRFGGYAWGEDYDFSHRTKLHFNEPLLILPKGLVVHHNVVGGRVDGVRKAASCYYNSAIIRNNFNKYKSDYGIFPFIWEQRIGRTLSLLVEGLTTNELYEGYKMYRKAIKDDLKKAP